MLPYWRARLVGVGAGIPAPRTFSLVVAVGVAAARAGVLPSLLLGIAAAAARSRSSCFPVGGAEFGIFAIGIEVGLVSTLRRTAVP